MAAGAMARRVRVVFGWVAVALLGSAAAVGCGASGDAADSTITAPPAPASSMKPSEYDEEVCDKLALTAEDWEAGILTPSGVLAEIRNLYDDYRGEVTQLWRETLQRIIERGSDYAFSSLASMAGDCNEVFGTGMPEDGPYDP